MASQQQSVTKVPETPKTPTSPLPRCPTVALDDEALPADQKSFIVTSGGVPIRYRSVFSVLADSDPNDPDDVPAMKCICGDDNCRKR